MKLKELTSDQVLNQLEKILATPEFSASKILSDFLQFVVNETLQGRAESIKEYTIALEVLGRKKDFDPKFDAVVRIHAGRLRRALHNYYSKAGSRDPVRIDIPKGGYQPVFEPASEGNLLPSTQEKLTGEVKSFPLRKPTLAVLPFRNLSDDPAQSFFAEGICVQLSAEFGRFQGLSVIAFQSSRHIAKEEAENQLIGEKLGADYLLSGSVRRSRDRIRIQIYLHRSDTGLQLWAQKYDRTISSDQLFDIEDDIVHRVIGAIGGHYGVIIRDVARASRPAEAAKMGAYDVVPLFYYFHLEHTKESFLRARVALEKAVQLDPEYAHAWAGLADLHFNALLMGFDRADDLVEKGMQYARKAVTLDPSSYFGYQVLALGHLILKQPEELIQASKKCLALNPHETISQGGTALCFAAAGLYPEAMAYFEEAIQLNPSYPWWFNVIPFLCYYHDQDYEKALKYAKKMNKPTTFWDPMLQAAALGQLGRTEACPQILQALRELDQNIAVNARTYLTNLLMSREMVDHLMEGLEKAGLKGT